MTSLCEAGLGSAWLMTQDAAGGRRFVREIGLSRRFGNLRGGEWFGPGAVGLRGGTNAAPGRDVGPDPGLV